MEKDEIKGLLRFITWATPYVNKEAPSLIPLRDEDDQLLYNGEYTNIEGKIFSSEEVVEDGIATGRQNFTEDMLENLRRDAEKYFREQVDY